MQCLALSMCSMKVNFARLIERVLVLSVLAKDLKDARAYAAEGWTRETLSQGFPNEPRPSRCNQSLTGGQSQARNKLEPEEDQGKEGRGFHS